jgi:two-component system response regulator RegA
MEVTRPVRNVLIVDDDKTTRVSCMLELGEHRRGLLAKDVPTAMTLVGTPELDLAIVDERLGPGLLVGAGLELVRDFKAARPDLVVVMASGVLTRHSEQLALELGADAVFEKSCDADGRSWIPTAAILAFVERGEPPPGFDPVEMKKLDRVERDYIIDTLLECSGNISQAARILGVARRTLQRKLQALGLG